MNSRKIRTILLRVQAAIALLMAVPLPGRAQAEHPQIPPEKAAEPRLRIETFATARAYAVGQTSITLIATVRNVGSAPLPEGTVTGRLSCISGLDYGDGDTIPRLPALIPNAVVTYRWRVVPVAASGPLVAAFALEYPGAAPDVRVMGIQRFAREPLEGVPSPLPMPVARTQGDRSVLENGKIRLRIEPSSANVPAAWLSVRSANGWRKAGVCLPIAEVLSGEGGQEPWWEVFRAEDVRAVNGIKEASLVITGGIGLRWRATLTLTLRQDSSVIDCDIQLAPLRSIKISGLRLATLHAGENGFGSDISEELPYSINGPNAVAAVRSGDLTVGSSWPTVPFFRDWATQPLADVPGADYRVIGAEHVTANLPVELNPGALVDFRCRLYALTPSASVRDAFQIIVPTHRSVAQPAPFSQRLLASRGVSPRMSTSRKALTIRRAGSSHRSTVGRNKKKTKQRASAKKKRSGRSVRPSKGKRSSSVSRSKKSNRSKQAAVKRHSTRRSSRRR